MHQETAEWEMVADFGAEVGECPLWHDPSGSLFWIDSHAPALFRTDLVSRATTRWNLPADVGSFSFTDDPDALLLALSTGLSVLRLASGTVEPFHAAPYDRSQHRFNDGRCDQAGRFWVGTIRLPGGSAPDGSGAFYRLDRQGLSPALVSTTIANGLAWSPDGRTMYLADRPNWRIVAMDYDVATGQASGGRTFATIPVGQYPDGAWVDVAGGYWIALYAAGRIVRFLPDGTMDRDVRAPTRHPTMVSFGGADGRTLFVTTARRTYEGHSAEAHAGAVFQCRLDIAGLPVRSYKGALRGASRA